MGTIAGFEVSKANSLPRLRRDNGSRRAFGVPGWQPIFPGRRPVLLPRGWWSRWLFKRPGPRRRRTFLRRRFSRGGDRGGNYGSETLGGGYRHPRRGGGYSSETAVATLLETTAPAGKAATPPPALDPTGPCNNAAAAAAAARDKALVKEGTDKEKREKKERETEYKTNTC